MGSRKILKRIAPYTLWGDRVYCKWRFYRRYGRFPEKDPQRFSDHLFALRTSGVNYDPVVQFLTDKEYAKIYFSSVLGAEYVIQTYRVLREKSELEDFELEQYPCVIKPTHASGHVILCHEKLSALDFDKLRLWFELNHYKRTREHNYRHLEPKIIVEEFFSEDKSSIPKDYKFLCFNGVPRVIQVDTGRFADQFQSFYDTGWNRIPVVALFPGKKEDEKRPVLLDRMLELACQLSAPFRFVRVDMYATSTEIRIGEMTFTPWSGYQPLQPAEAEVIWGSYFNDLSFN